MHLGIGRPREREREREYFQAMMHKEDISRFYADVVVSDSERTDVAVFAGNYDRAYYTLHHNAIILATRDIH